MRAGLSLPEAVAQLGERGPVELREPFAAFAEDYRATGRFGDELDALKERLADPVADRIVEALRLTREVGGTDLGRLLRTLSTFLREDVRTRGELEARQSWTVNAARLAVAAPWIVLALLATRPETADAYDSPAGIAVLAVGGVVRGRRVPRDAADRAAARRPAGAAVSPGLVGALVGLLGGLGLTIVVLRLRSAPDQPRPAARAVPAPARHVVGTASVRRGPRPVRDGRAARSALMTDGVRLVRGSARRRAERATPARAAAGRRRRSSSSAPGRSSGASLGLAAGLGSGAAARGDPRRRRVVLAVLVVVCGRHAACWRATRR